MDKNIKQLVLDAGPLITQSASSLQQYAETFYTTPGVHSELKDEQARNQLILWNDNLKIRHPSSQSIKKVENFAKLTGDFAVLSVNDIHIIALAYELEVEANGDERIRKFPGEKVAKPKQEPKQVKEGEFVQKKPRRRGGKKQREKREAQIQKELDEVVEGVESVVLEEGSSEEVKEQEVEEKEDTPEQETPEQETPEQETPEQETPEQETPEQETPEQETPEQETPEQETPESNSEQNEQDINEEFNEDEDDGDWITPENLRDEMLKDNNEEVGESSKDPIIKVAFSTGDFACQNVAMQMGLNLMNSLSGKQIKRIRNYMYRCHACFKLTPIPKNGKPKHFCPKCGGNTLLRCAVSIDNNTGKVTPHLKANFQWIKRGNVFSEASPLSKNFQKRQGNGGYQHNKENRHKTLQNPILYSEDQKEYQKAIKDDDWQRRKNDKLLQEWIGGGSADNYISPFNSMQVKGNGVRVGKGRFVNSSRGKKK